MRRLNLLVIVISILSLTSCGEGQTTPPVPEKPRMLIVSIDGLRPDLLTRARTPVIHSLLERGAFSMWARTTKVAVTLPSHVSMLTGVPPERHRISWNSEADAPPGAKPAVPTLFELAHASGLHVAMAAGKVKFDVLASPGTLESVFLPASSKCDDAEVAGNAVRIITETKPDLMFVHFPGPDSAGHSKGWGSPEQIQVIEQIDVCLGQLLDAYKKIGWTDSLYTLVSADHGGSGLTHGANDDKSSFIPWILVGPQVRVGYDLTRYKPLDINTEDTFATACKILNIRYTHQIDGKPIEAAFVQTELLQPK